MIYEIALLPVHNEHIEAFRRAFAEVAPLLSRAKGFRPCDELAGDILNIFQLDAKHIGFYVLDVSGHGVSAALLSVAVSHFLSPLASNSLL